jgi:hypothetical protein
MRKDADYVLRELERLHDRDPKESLQQLRKLAQFARASKSAREQGDPINMGGARTYAEIKRLCDAIDSSDVVSPQPEAWGAAIKAARDWLSEN